MILQAWDREYVQTNINSMQEAELFYSLKDHLDRAGVLRREHIPALVRYVKMQVDWLNLLKNDPKHYMVEKLAGHLQQLEDDLCLTPKSMLAYKKDETLMQAKKKRINTDKD